MKIKSLLVVMFIVMAISPLALFAQTGWGQVTMSNTTSMTLDLYVDNEYGCQALGGLMCTAQVKEGEHTLSAQNDSGETLLSQSTYINSGDSITWTITETITEE